MESNHVASGLQPLSLHRCFSRVLFGAVDVVCGGLVGGEASFLVMVVEGDFPYVAMSIAIVIVNGYPGVVAGGPV